MRETSDYWGSLILFIIAAFPTFFDKHGVCCFILEIYYGANAGVSHQLRYDVNV